MSRKHRILSLVMSVWFIAAAALGARLAFLWDQQRKIPHDVLATVPFLQESGNIATALAEGRGFANLYRQNTGPTAWLAPAYPFLLSLIFRAFGTSTLASFFVAVFLNAIFSASATFPLYASAAKFLRPAGAAMVAWAWVILPAGVMMPFEWIWDTSLSVLLATALLWFTLELSESPSQRLWLGYGLCWALALLTNPSLGAALPFLFGWAVLRARRMQRFPWMWPVAAILLICVGCLPWMARNYATFHRWIPIRSNLPLALWNANNDIFDEHAAHGIQRISAYEQVRRYAQLGETHYLAEKWAQASDFIRKHPGLYVRLTGRRIVSTWTGTEHPFRDFARADSAVVRAVLLSNFLLTAGALLGLVLLLRTRHRLALPLACFPVIFPVVYYLTISSLRYRHPIDPLILLLGGFGIAACFPKRFLSGQAPGAGLQPGPV